MIAAESPLAELGLRAAAPLAQVVAVVLLLAGHNRPGGGFAAGLVLGAVAALRAVVGLATPIRATVLVGTGGVLAGAVALAPLVVGRALLDQAVVELSIPVLGPVKTGTALVLDIGVTLIVVGLVVALLEGLGARRRDGATRSSDRLTGTGRPPSRANSAVGETVGSGR